MKRFTLFLLLALAAAPTWAAGIFDGTSSDLSAEVESEPVDYPVILTCWFRPANTSHRGTLVAMSDEGSGGSVDSLVLEYRGDGPGDLLHATSTAAGASSNAATANGGTSTATWYLAVGIFEAENTRFAVLSSGQTHDPTWSNEETTTRNVGALRRISIGTVHDGSISNFFNGRIAHAAIFTAVENEKIDVAVRQLASGLPANSERLIIRDNLLLYQPLESGANGADSVGPEMEASNLTFDSDYPATASWYTTWGVASRAGNGVYRARWPADGPTPGPLPGRRLVTYDGTAISLAGASDTNVIGATWNDGGPSLYASGEQRVTALGVKFPLYVTVASGDTIAAGDEVFQAADGTVSDAGELRVGVAITGGSGGETIQIVPH